MKNAKVLNAPKPLGSHPSYLEEQSGSSQYAIAKYLKHHYSTHLPSNFKKKLSMQLRESTMEGKLLKTNRSYKLADESMKPEKAEKASSSSMALKVVRRSQVFKKAAAGRWKTKVAGEGAAEAKAKVPSEGGEGEKASSEGD